MAFLIIASFGILFVGCGKGSGTARSGTGTDDLTFTQEDAARFQRLASQPTATGSVASGSHMSVLSRPIDYGTGALSDTEPVLDLSMVKQYDQLRTVATPDAANTYRVMNSFVNVRAEPRATSALIGKFNRNDLVPVVEFVNGDWAKVTLPGGKTGYCAIDYLARVTSEDRLAGEKKAFDGLYYVHYSHVNVRKTADQKSEKLGEIPSLTFVRPLSKDKDWARVQFQGKEGYVSLSYLQPFMPIFVVRQEAYTLPILRYDVSQAGVLTTLTSHVTSLKQAGVHFLTMSALRDFVLKQEGGDVRLPEKSVVIAVTGVTPETVRQAADALYQASVPATFFIQSHYIGISGITAKTIGTLIADDFDVQSGGHTGDDLRALTNAQIKLEVSQSRKLIEEITQQPVFAIDYPQGGVNDRVMQAADAAGYLFGISNAPDKQFQRDQFLRLPSYTVLSSMSADDVVRMVK